MLATTGCGDSSSQVETPSSPKTVERLSPEANRSERGSRNIPRAGDWITVEKLPSRIGSPDGFLSTESLYLEWRKTVNLVESIDLVQLRYPLVRESSCRERIGTQLSVTNGEEETEIAFGREFDRMSDCAEDDVDILAPFGSIQLEVPTGNSLIVIRLASDCKELSDSSSGEGCANDHGVKRVRRAENEPLANR
jgi:hypothetical protein